MTKHLRLMPHKQNAKATGQAPTKTSQLGFTIIEVLVVLSIAGVIMILIFLVIPALQRNARNYARRVEASRVASAVASYVGTHNYLLPGVQGNGQPDLARWVSDCQLIAGIVGPLHQFGDTNGDLSPWCVDNPGGAASQNQFVNDYTWHGNVSSSTPNATWLVYTVFATCPPNGTDSTITLVDAGPKQSVVLFPIDTPGDQQVGCVQAT
jgi:prepilin-type N-terminal cleavage/methylation domain-containing protein